MIKNQSLSNEKKICFFSTRKKNYHLPLMNKDDEEENEHAEKNGVRLID